MEKYFKLYSNCILVKGAKRSIICDLQKQTFHIIPNTLYNILIKKKYNTKKISQLYQKFNDNKSTLEEYFDFLINKNLILLSESKKNLNNLPKISKKFIVPNKITNAIIDFSVNIYDYKKIINQLDKLFCKDLMLRFFNIIEIRSINEIIDFTNNSNISNVELVLPYCSDINENNINNIINKSNKISKVYIHSTSKELKENIIHTGNTKVIFTKQKIDNSECCGFISPEYFQVNNDMFLQSLNFNNCLYRKIGIDINGEIKNCPAMKKSFGNINNVSLEELIEKKDFQKKWYLKKDNIKVCKDCEFRYICSDCRFHISNPNNIRSKPLKCNYNPYLAEWKQ